MKIFKLVFVAFLSLTFLFCIISCKNISRLSHAHKLFDEDKIVDNFRTLDQHFPISTMEASHSPYSYVKGRSMDLPNSFDLENERVQTTSFLEGSKTTGLIVIQDNKIVLEEYYLGNKEDTQNIAWSVSKSFLSTLFGIAIDEGYIKNVNETVESYVPELKGSAYDGVKIKDVLQMSSGVKFNEDYGNFFSDINRWGRAFAMGKSQDDFASTLKRGCKPGTYHHYVSIDTHVLGMVIARATNSSVSEYMQEKLWNPLGMEYDGYWVTDSKGVEVAMCGLNVCLRDFAKLGSLYLNKGMWNGKRIVSEKWIKDSTTPDAAHLMPNPNNPQSVYELGYGFQWWLPEGSQGEILAQGVYNQTIYVNPSSNTVIVKLSANDRFNEADYIPSQWQATVAFNRKIVENLKEKS